MTFKLLGTKLLWSHARFRYCQLAEEFGHILSGNSPFPSFPPRSPASPPGPPQISRLQLLQKAHIARTAHAETRLLATLDILDATRAEAAQDAATLRSANAALSAKIGGVRAAAREIEAERDDLRHAVQKLIDRGTSYPSGLRGRRLIRG